ncbi:hypothetical protein BDR05DRAFT_1006898 [Suillus weaverae]|nr:hypothetical protein BDR05DRAFT_1006898 [Suillus weaverae]
MLQEQEKLDSQPHEPDCNLETVIAAIMLWSDSTHLASFGNASLWPIYLFIGNQSKYICGKPTSFAAHHLAYIPKLSDTIQDFYKDTFGRSATAAVLTHCKRELMQAIWRFLLDAEFIDAYRHGFIVKFPDGVSRRVFPCYSVVSSVIEKIVGATSVAPIQNAFSDKLAEFGFDFHSMLVPDIMHEFELGVWKATLTHLLRILYAYGGNAVTDLNEQ